MTDFDVASLEQFSPAKAMCIRCHALLFSPFNTRIEQPQNLIKLSLHQRLTNSSYYLRCPVCNKIYLASKAPHESILVQRVLSELEFRPRLPENLTQHCLSLLSTSSDHKQGILGMKNSEPPLNRLLATLNQASSFVHLTSYGISHQILGALKTVALKGVVVRGIISNVHGDMMEELNKTKEEMAWKYSWHIQAYAKDNGMNMPHQKVIIFDGLIAFKGSTNYTITGLRNAARKLDLLERVTNIKKVVELNNEYFSSTWDYDKSYGNSVDFDNMPGSDVPF